MRVLVAPDSMGGLLGARRLAAAIARGWQRARPDDEVVQVPMSDGGEGLLDVLHRPRDTRVEVEVAGPLGHPVDAWVSLRDDGTAVVESALACGLAHLRPEQRDPLRATTYGVGQLLDAARDAGARRVLVGLGGSATVDGGAGALTGLGFRLRVADGSGLKVGAADLHRVVTIERGWADPAWDDLEVEVLADVQTVLGDAARVFGPQKGATPPVVEQLDAALAHWADVVAAELGDGDLTRPSRHGRGRRARLRAGRGPARQVGAGRAGRRRPRGPRRPPRTRRRRDHRRGAVGRDLVAGQGRGGGARARRAQPASGSEWSSGPRTRAPSTATPSSRTHLRRTRTRRTSRPRQPGRGWRTRLGPA